MNAPGRIIDAPFIVAAINRNHHQRQEDNDAQK
jgi:hypothetical protein